MRIAISAALTVLASTAVAVVAAPAPANPFIGTWTVTDAKQGPWVKPGETALPVDPKILHAKITFSATSVKGPAPLGCARAVLKVTTVGPDYLFEGGLADNDPHKQAAALGFTSDKIVSMNEGCASSSADIEMDFDMIDANTAVFGLNDRVYYMKRDH